MTYPMTFEDWMAQVRLEAKARNLDVPGDLDETQEFEWRNQYENQMTPAEAIYYIVQNAKEP